MQYIAIIRAVLALLPVIVEAVKAIESAFPASGQGAIKLEAIRNIVQSAYDTATDVSLRFDQLWPTLQSAVSSVVSIANATGLFKKS